MLGKRMEDALNGQVVAELYSAYLYLSMVAYFESANCPGAAGWMRAQVQEEFVHAMKLFDFVNEQGSRVILTVIDAPPSEWESPLAAFEAAYKHEQKVTGLIGELVEIAKQENDGVTVDFLQWFVNEQVEEEESTSEVVEKLTGGELSNLDKQLGQRALK